MSAWPAVPGSRAGARWDVADPAGAGAVRAAGAVVWRPAAAGVELALVHRPRYDDWSHPKGKCRRGEHVLAAAVREVAEETGLRVVLGRPLRPSVYRAFGRIKRVSYWAGRCAGTASFAPGEEVDQVAWVPPGEARLRLSYQRDRVLLEEFLSGPARTAPLILLRHAQAGRRPRGRDAAGRDLGRPLDSRGAAQAKLLAAILACYGPCRVISSGAERCLATVRPYAAVTGAAVEPEAAFTVRPDGGGDLAAAASRAAALAAAGGPVLICAHRENLPAIAEAACRALGARPPGGRPLGKGAFWVLHSAGGALAACERHDPGA